MPREKRSQDEIRSEVARLLNSGRQIALSVPLPVRLRKVDPLDGGCNWTMHHFLDLGGHEDAVADAIMQVKCKWNLSETVGTGNTQKLAYHIEIEREYLPMPELWHASRSIFEAAEVGAPGYGHLLLASMTLLAFTVEAFVQTYGPKTFASDEWTGSKGIERKPVRDKLKQIAKRHGVVIDYGKQPWVDIAKLLNARDAIAHPRPALISHSGPISIGEFDHPQAAAESMVTLEWEELLGIERLQKTFDSVETALETILKASGHDWDLRLLGGSSYMLSGVHPGSRRNSGAA
ncbi:MAG: hypothetical protein ABIU07_06325 [Ramlibacter sp.]